MDKKWRGPKPPPLRDRCNDLVVVIVVVVGALVRVGAHDLTRSFSDMMHAHHIPKLLTTESTEVEVPRNEPRLFATDIVLVPHAVLTDDLEARWLFIAGMWGNALVGHDSPPSETKTSVLH